MQYKNIYIISRIDITTHTQEIRANKHYLIYVDVFLNYYDQF